MLVNFKCLKIRENLIWNNAKMYQLGHLMKNNSFADKLFVLQNGNGLLSLQVLPRKRFCCEVFVPPI